METRPKKRFFLSLLTLCMFVSGIYTLIILSKEPSADRNWAPEFSKLNTIESNPNGTLTFYNVRDWTYDGQEIASKNWIDMTVDPKDIDTAWFFLDRFGSWSAIAHTFLSFQFKDGRTLSFSIEARREEVEQYSIAGGVLRAYEIQYLWGTERDFIPERLTYYKNPLFMYQLSVPPEKARALFESVVSDTNVLAQNPRFYNTLTANCTNLLAKIVNEHYPGTLPYDLSWNFTGWSDAYLMHQGFIGMDGTEDATRIQADLSPFADQIEKIATSSPEVFSANIREVLKP
jgi:hypothetical protein